MDHRLMFYGAKPNTFEKARLLRESMTAAESHLWTFLSKNKLGVRFKPQHPADIFILDFYCHELKLAIEIDGGIHKSQSQYDQSRTDELEKYKIKIIRFTNDQVIEKTEKVLEKIRQEISERRKAIEQAEEKHSPKTNTGQVEY